MSEPVSINFVLLSGCIALLVFPFLFSSLGASSWFLGTFVGSLIAFFLAILARPVVRVNWFRVFCLLLFLSLDIVFTSIYYQEFPLLKQLGALFASVLLLIISMVFSDYVWSLSGEKLKAYVSFALVFILCASLISTFTGLHLLRYPKAVFYFSEPSHFALAISPFALYASLTCQKRISFLLLLVFFVLSIFLQNLTLFFLFIELSLLLAFRFRFNLASKLASSLLLVVSVLPFVVNNKYFYERLSLDTANISALVYLRGFQSAVFSLANPPFFGFGFQMMELRSPPTDASVLLSSLKLESLNANDGGFVAAKFVSEFGWLGLLVLFYFVFLMLPRLFVSLSFLSKRMPSKHECVFISSILSVFTQLFVRGSGYLGPFFVLVYFSIVFLPRATDPLGSVPVVRSLGECKEL